MSPSRQPALPPVSSPDQLPALRDVIAALSLSAKKSLSQNFILDLNLTGRIARSGGRLAGRTVVEVGPGPGGLTRALLTEGAERVIAVERDERCRPALEQIASAWPERLDVHFADALETDWETLLVPAHGPTTGRLPRGPVTIAANLPYSIATKLLTGWLETEPWPPWFDTMVLMFQAEVADRILAEPRTKAYGRLAVLAQWRCHGERAMTLKPEAFLPPPKVSSTVVVLKPKPVDGPPGLASALSKVTAAAFGQRRKMLRQSLKQLTPMPELLLTRADIAPDRRAETLSIEEFVRLATIWHEAADRQ